MRSYKHTLICKGFSSCCCFCIWRGRSVIFYRQGHSGWQTSCNMSFIYNLFFIIQKQSGGWKLITLPLYALFLLSKMWNFLKSLSCSTNFDCFSLAGCCGHSISFNDVETKLGWDHSWPHCRVSQPRTWYTFERLNGVLKDCFQSLLPTTIPSSPSTKASNSL